VLEREEVENHQVEDPPLSPVTDTRSLDDADFEAAYGPSNGTPGTDEITESVNGSERNTQSGHIDASPSATGVSSEKSIDKGSPANGGKLSTDSVGRHEIKATEPYLSKGINLGASIAPSLLRDPTFELGALSPGTRSFLKFAQRISRLKRGKPSAESISVQAKKSKRASWGRQWSDKVPSVDSLSDAISSLRLDSRRLSRRASEASFVSSLMLMSALSYSEPPFSYLELPSSYVGSSHSEHPSSYSELPSYLIDPDSCVGSSSYSYSELPSYLENLDSYVGSSYSELPSSYSELPFSNRSNISWVYRPLQPVAELPELETASPVCETSGWGSKY
jgi:hypothetical protein